MERVKTLIEKLQQLQAQHADTHQLLTAVDMLRSELLHLQQMQRAGKAEQPAVAIAIAQASVPGVAEQKGDPQAEEGNEKIVEVLQVDEAEVEAEIEELKRIAKEKSSMGVQNKPTVLFDPLEDIPTLAHQQPAQVAPAQELHQKLNAPSAAEPSVNERLKENKFELFDSLAEAPIRDLKKAIGINDKFVFVNELFRGDETMYERSIKTINSFSIYPEAEYWIKRELKLKLGWDDRTPTVKQFDQLVKRRFL